MFPCSPRQSLQEDGQEDGFSTGFMTKSKCAIKKFNFPLNDKYNIYIFFYRVKGTEAFSKTQIRLVQCLILQSRDRVTEFLSREIKKSKMRRGRRRRKKIK